MAYQKLVAEKMNKLKEAKKYLEEAEKVFSDIQYDWDEESICEYINNHIKDLHVDDCGAFQVRDEKIGKVVDMEWNDGVSGFVLKDVLDYIKENGTVKRSELMEFTC